MSLAPLVVLGLVVLALRWLIKHARVTPEDVSSDAKGPNAGAHLPSVHPDVRDVVVPRSMDVDIETERYRNAAPSATGV